MSKSLVCCLFFFRCHASENQRGYLLILLSDRLGGACVTKPWKASFRLWKSTVNPNCWGRASLAVLLVLFLILANSVEIVYCYFVNKRKWFMKFLGGILKKEESMMFVLVYFCMGLCLMCTWCDPRKLWEVRGVVYFKEKAEKAHAFSFFFWVKVTLCCPGETLPSWENEIRDADFLLEKELVSLLVFGFCFSYL